MSANLLLWIDEPQEGNELAGEPTGGWERTKRKAWFEVMPAQSGREYPSTNQMQSNVTHTLRCAYFAGANPRMRLSKGDADNPTRAFNVVSVVNEREENRFLVWQVTEVA